MRKTATSQNACGRLNPGNWSGAEARAAQRVATQPEFISFATSDDVADRFRGVIDAA